MKPNKAKAQKLRLILAQAHKNRRSEPPEPGPAWRAELMSRIRELEPAAARVEQWANLERMVWRLVPAAGVVALIMAILLSVSPAAPNRQLASLLNPETVESSLYAYYQSESRDE